MINKAIIERALQSRWDLSFDTKSGVLTKSMSPVIVRLAGTLDEQVKQLRDGGFSEIVEELAEDIKANPDIRRVPFVISDASVDRHGDTASPDGWDLSQYQKTVLWSHDHSMLPVAKAEKTWKHGGKLKSVAAFVPKELNAFGWAVGELVAAGFINACSVGFIPHDGSLNEERLEETGKYGLDFTKQELIEWSVCNVGSNRNALVQGRHFDEAKKIVAETEIKNVLEAVREMYADRPLSEAEQKSLTEHALGVFTNVS